MKMISIFYQKHSSQLLSFVSFFTTPLLKFLLCATGNWLESGLSFPMNFPTSINLFLGSKNAGSIVLLNNALYD